MYERTPQTAFYRIRYTAGRRGIPYNLSFEQWVWIWQRALGQNWWEYLGKRRGQYCMARFGDRGTYEIGNVQIILGTENVSEAKTGRYNFCHLNGILGLPT